jgi:hypothetical protein
MVLRDIEIGKNAQGKKALDIHISKLLKIEKNIKVRLMLQHLSASLEMKGLGYMKYLLLSRM